MIFTGVVVAAVPGTVQAVAGRAVDTDGQAFIAISLSLGAFIAAIVNAVVLESRLGDSALRQRTYVPTWAAVAGVVGSLAIVAFPYSLLVIGGSLPLIMTTFQLGRTHGTVQGLWRSELIAGVVLVVGCGGSIIAGVCGLHVIAFRLVGCSAAIVILIRQLSARRVDRTLPSFARRAWIGSETLVVAATPFVMNVSILIFLGPAEAVGFRLVLTVLGVLQPLLGYLRTMLLDAASRWLTLLMSALSVGALVLIVVADVVGVFDSIFGRAWDGVSMTCLWLACAWKLISIPATVPFARMRRRGVVAQVFAVRVISTVTYICLGVLGALFAGSAVGVFVAFVAAEVITFGLYLKLSETGVSLEPGLHHA
jgi:hypothetical protein